VRSYRSNTPVTSHVRSMINGAAMTCAFPTQFERAKDFRAKQKLDNGKSPAKHSQGYIHTLRQRTPSNAISSCSHATDQTLALQPNTPARVITPSNSSMLTPPSPPPVASLIMSFNTFSGTSSRNSFATRRKSLILISRSCCFVNKA
jgi:hypothetical protein